jgi:hypothetical protein
MWSPGAVTVADVVMRIRGLVGRASSLQCIMKLNCRTSLSNERATGLAARSEIGPKSKKRV